MSSDAIPIVAVGSQEVRNGLRRWSASARSCAVGRFMRSCGIDGLIHDARFLKRLGFNAWSHGCPPREIVGARFSASVTQTIRFGDVEIAGGDAIFAGEASRRPHRGERSRAGS